MVSIVLLFMILIFLYKALDITQKSNTFFNAKVENIVNDNRLKKLLIEDIFESTKPIKITRDKNNNNIIQIQTLNTYHNVFFKHVTYFVTQEDNLIRIESLKEFDKTKLNDDFFKDVFIDIIVAKLERFEVSKLKDNEKAFSIMLKKKNKKVMLFGSLQI